MKWKVIKQKDLLMSEGLRIAYLKDEYWPYGLESQILWMRDNVAENDIHLMGEEQSADEIKLLAYITLTNLQVLIDEKHLDYIGVGGVCVDKSCQHSGMGRLLMQEAERYISCQNKPGVLLCKDSLTPFYEKCGWRLLRFQSAEVAGNKYEHNIMLLGKSCTCSNIIIDRNF